MDVIIFNDGRVNKGKPLLSWFQYLSMSLRKPEEVSFTPLSAEATWNCGSLLANRNLFRNIQFCEHSVYSVQLYSISYLQQETGYLDLSSNACQSSRSILCVISVSLTFKLTELDMALIKSTVKQVYSKTLKILKSEIFKNFLTFWFSKINFAFIFSD